MSFFSGILLDWYKKNGRNLPWRNTKDPYRIWISEIILQQTRVAQGYDYYLRFISRFPDVFALAEASGDEVMKSWQGLGYYSRARNLHEAAREIALKGEFPKTYEEVRGLKGVGDYTAAAICSLAYGMPQAVVDGNVYRVLSRWLGITTPIDTGKGKKEFAALAEELLDVDCPAEYNQAIMDFGALVCTPKKPACMSCPFVETCVARKKGLVDDLPCKSRKTKVSARYFHYFYIHTDEEMLLYKRREGDVWQHLYEFPLVETAAFCNDEELFSSAGCKRLLDGAPVEGMKDLEREKKHVLSHRCIYASCYEVKVKSLVSFGDEFLRVPIVEMDKFPVSNLISHFFSLILKPELKTK